MHSGFQIPEIERQIQQSHHENSCTSLLLSMNQTHNILEQIHGTLPTTQQLFLDQHLFLPPHHHHQQYVGGGGGGAASSSSFFPVNFKLGLNEICTSNDNINKDVRCINEREDALLRGSEQYEIPEVRQHSSLGIPHCWQNQEDSSIKQQPLWEPLPAEVSNENSDIVDRQDQTETMNQKEDLITNCLESKTRVVYGDLVAVYRRLSTAESNQTRPNEEEEEEEEEEVKNGTKRKKRKKRKETGYNDKLINPMKEFFEGLVKQVMDHQENLQKKFTEVVERLDEERREREEVWRNRELAHFEKEAEERAREKASAASREATIVSYLEKIAAAERNIQS